MIPALATLAVLLAPVTAAQAESFLPFIERVGLPWIMVFAELAVILWMSWSHSNKTLPELRAIAVALTNAGASNARLADEVRQHTPPMGTPVPPAIKEKP